jgi:integrase
LTSGPEQLTAARLALAELGVTVADLEPNQDPARPPTLSEYLPVVIAAAGTGANRTYGTYWARMATRWGERRLDEVHASDIEAMNTATTTARSRRTSRDGRHAGEHVIAAARAIYNRAIADGLIDQKNSPAHRVAKPRRLPNTRRALTAWELEQINLTARISGNDTILDALLLRLHTETACRRGGALAIQLADLDTDRCLILQPEFVILAVEGA